MTFKADIDSKEVEIQDIIAQRRIETFNRWKDFLFASDINQPNDLSNTQIAFLTILENKYEKEIYFDIKDKVYKSFFDFYEGEVSDIEIILQGLDISNINKGEWSILYEDESVDPIVHTFFKGWDFDYCAITH